jgi:hypothetical protein
MDRTTQILFAAIALALWGNMAVSIYNTNRILRQGMWDGDVATQIGALYEEVHEIADGRCSNGKLC